MTLRRYGARRTFTPREDAFGRLAAFVRLGRHTTGLVGVAAYCALAVRANAIDKTGSQMAYPLWETGYGNGIIFCTLGSAGVGGIATSRFSKFKVKPLMSQRVTDCE
uniref:Uncharacterized protein n=1 Tax=Anopheles melas TaxID=34690 RepID=A0A182TR15_9DIPT